MKKAWRLLFSVLLCTAFAAAQGFTSSQTVKTPGSTGSQIQFTATQSNTTTATTSGMTTDITHTGCSCTRTVYNSLYDSTGLGLLLDANANGSCLSQLQSSFTYDLLESTDYQWETGSVDTEYCSGQSPVSTWHWPKVLQHTRVAHTHAIWTGTIYNCETYLGVELCSYGVQPYCTNTGNPTSWPSDNLVHNIIAPSSPAYDLYAACKWYGSPASWHCPWPVGAAIKDATEPPVRKACDVLAPPQ